MAVNKIVIAAIMKLIITDQIIKKQNSCPRLFIIHHHTAKILAPKIRIITKTVTKHATNLEY